MLVPIVGGSPASPNVSPSSAVLADKIPGVSISYAEPTRNTFTGTAAALIAAGLMTADQLAPQPGRPLGFTAFRPDGEPCPTNLRLSRHEGFKTIRATEGGLYSVGITVPNDEQRRRRAAGDAVRAEEREVSLNQQIAKRGRELQSMPLRHEVNSSYEAWDGTKAQLQSQFLGVGMAFPGERGAPSKLHCKCPLGFDVEIVPAYDSAEAACGRYRAISRFGVGYSRPSHAETRQFAPGVVLTVGEFNRSYRGTAAALVAAGLASMDQFPGQPNRPLTRCTYRGDGTQKNSGNHHDDGRGMVICKSGKTFTIETSLTEDEERARLAHRQAAKAECDAEDAKRSEERKAARAAFWQLQNVDKGVSAFRADKAQTMRMLARMISNLVALPDGAFTLCPDDAEKAELDEALENLVAVVSQCAVSIDRTAQRAAKSAKAATAARTDAGLQSFLSAIVSAPTIADSKEE